MDIERLMLVQPDCGEQALEVADQLARSGEVGMIVIDSVSALVPRCGSLDRFLRQYDVCVCQRCGPEVQIS